MKLSFLFLAVFFMATSFGQNIFYWPFHPSALNGRSSGLQWPRSYYRGAAGFYNQPDPFFDEGDYGEEPSDEVYGRSKLGLEFKKRVPSNKFNQKNNKNEDVGRLFIPSSAPATTYTTAYSTTSTVTLTSVVTCYKSALFVSTTPCRRKRDTRKILESIDPTPNGNQIETTSIGINGVEADSTRGERDIQSSRELQDFFQNDDFEIRPRFGFNAINSLLFPSALTKTTTITLPVYYTFATNYTTRVLTTGFAAAAGLTCLPSGFTLC